MLIVLILDILIVIPVYANNDIDELSGNWLLASMNGLSLFMFPGIVFFIYIIIILASKISLKEEEKIKKMISILWIIIAITGLVLMIYSTITGFVKMSIPIIFYVALGLLSLSIISRMILIKKWTKINPLPKWTAVEFAILTFISSTLVFCPYWDIYL